MAKNGPIVIIEDDIDERHLYEIIFKKVGSSNHIKFFENGKEAFEYLKSTSDNPFLIICDMKMPEMDGLELRQRISGNPHLKKKATPFIFRTGTATHSNLATAYELSVQGFFEKTHDIDKFEHQIRKMMEYWRECLEPNDI